MKYMAQTNIFYNWTHHELLHPSLKLGPTERAWLKKKEKVSELKMISTEASCQAYSVTPDYVYDLNVWSTLWAW